jgi:surface carbohydrate biosynthesis protein
MKHEVPLIIPVENQVRELDPKLLLACIAARRGFTAVIGSHREIDFRISRLPRGLYLNKSMTARNLKMFWVMRWAGHQILTWDEEALVHLPADVYYSRRLSPVAIRYVNRLFAWGEDNAELWRRYPHLPPDMPIHVTGNPRNDMLRPELQAFYAEEVEAIRRAHGDYFLINTNFNHVNAFFPAQNLFKPAPPGRRPKFGKAGVGMTRTYAEGLRDHKQAVFEAFQRLIPRLAAAFPALTIVVRPHPTESQDVYRKIAAENPQIRVTNAGNVVPWLLAARALIHNGCTTGVEAFVMRVPAVSYRAVVNETYDDGFYRLPNRVSHSAFSFEELRVKLQAVLDGRLGAAEGGEREAFVRRYLAAQDGALACERLIDVIEEVLAQNSGPQPPALPSRALGAAFSAGRWAFKQLVTRISNSHAPPEFHRHRYPGIDIDELRRRIARFQQVLNDPTPICAEPLAEQVFRVYRK